MKAVFFYCTACAALLLVSLALKELPESKKGFAVMAVMGLLTCGLLWRIVRAHK